MLIYRNIDYELNYIMGDNYVISSYAEYIREGMKHSRPKQEE